MGHGYGGNVNWILTKKVGNGMRSLLLLILLQANSALATVEMCEVKVCNRLERFSLNVFSHLKDRYGETCFDTLLPKADAVEGKVLSTESKWYQGTHFNPTKKSVTRVKKVGACHEVDEVQK